MTAAAAKSEAPKLPSLVVVPPDARRDRCLACDIPLYAVGRAPISCESTFTYRGVSTDMRPHGVKPPTDTEPGLGWNHFADCPERDRFRRGRPPGGLGRHPSPHPAADAAPERTTLVERAVLPSDAHDTQDPGLLAEIVRQRAACKSAGLVCSVPDCEATSVIVITDAAGEKLTAFPCSEHADAVVDAMHAAGHTVRAEPPTKFLENVAHPEWRPACIRRAHDVRTYFAGRGAIYFPPASHGSRRGL